MGQLAGFRYRDIIKRLKQLGFEFDRQAAGSHEIWYNPSTNRYTTIPNHPGSLPWSRVMPAGLKKTVAASSATAALPAKALPRPLTPCSRIANPPAITSLDIATRPTVPIVAATDLAFPTKHPPASYL